MPGSCTFLQLRRPLGEALRKIADEEGAASPLGRFAPSDLPLSCAMSPYGGKRHVLASRRIRLAEIDTQTRHGIAWVCDSATGLFSRDRMCIQT